MKALLWVLVIPGLGYIASLIIVSAYERRFNKFYHRGV